MADVIFALKLTEILQQRPQMDQKISEYRSPSRPQAVLDFLLLGGGSLAFLALTFLIPASQENRAILFAFWLQLFINFPHFAHSYQIFYSDFSRKLGGIDYPRPLRQRFYFAGIIVPILLFLFLSIAASSTDPVYMGYAVHAVLLSLGWHYVKQGYGILIVDGIRYRFFFTNTEKKLLLVGCYITWICAWVGYYARGITKAELFWFIPFRRFAFPHELFYLSIVVVMIAGALLVAVTIRAVLRSASNSIPVNGIIAFYSSIYVWLFGLQASLWNPIFVAFIPTFHSLQYLLMVWRYQSRKCRSVKSESTGLLLSPQLRFAGFVATGLLLGASFFIAIPVVFERCFPYDHTLFGQFKWFGVFSVFINIHHYFIDNVIWRRENPLVARYLFA